jgi:hypothetical protein
MNNETKQYWLQTIQKYEMQNFEFYNFDLESCLQILEKDPSNYFAALNAFWSVYLCSDETSMPNDTQLARIEHVVQHFYVPSDVTSEKITEIIEKKAQLVLHMVGILLVSRLGPNLPSVEESPKLARILEMGYEAIGHVYFDFEYSPEWGKRFLKDTLLGDFTYSLLIGIISTEYGFYLLNRRKHEEAFETIVGTSCFLFGCSIKSEWRINEIDGKLGMKSPEFAPYIPHSRAELEIQDIVDLFFELKSNYKTVKNWNSIAETCNQINSFGTNYLLYDPHTIVTSHEDGSQELWAVEFWASTEAFARSNISSNELFKLQDQLDEKLALERLQTDFFEIYWDKLSNESKQYLVQAETGWRKKRYRDMLESFRIALETELPILFPLLQKAYDQSRVLDLTDMVQSLKNNNMIRSQIDKNLGKSDSSYVLTTLPIYLSQLIEIRRRFVHPDPRFPININDIEIAKDTRRRLLGIRCHENEAVLYRLLQIKSKIIR